MFIVGCFVVFYLFVGVFVGDVDVGIVWLCGVLLFIGWGVDWCCVVCCGVVV